MSEANKMQVGGDHYRSEYQHWTLVERLDLGYLIGCSTKYVSRWRKKNGAEDLKKALHYLNKRAEAAPVPPPKVPMQVAVREVDAFVAANQLTHAERQYVLLASVAQTPEDFEYVRSLLFELLDEAEGPADPKPVSLTEENHYSERAGDN